MAKTIKLGQLIRKTHIKFCDFDGDKNLEVLGVSNIEGITRTTHKKSADLSNYLLIKPNSFAYNPYRINVGSIGLTPSAITGIVSPAYIVFQVDEEKLIPEVLLDFLKSDEGLRQINRLARGTVRKALRYDDLCEIDFPNLSFAEQEQLVRRKAKLNTNREILLSEISHQETLLTKLKQAILQEAIQGKLTVDWRKENPDVEPASQLLERIQKEKQRLIAEKKMRKEKPLPPITPEEIPFEIPDSWAWCRMGNSGLLKRGKSKHRPRNDKRLFDGGKIPFVQTGDVARSKHNAFRIETCSGYYNEVGLAQSQLWPSETMCITIAANIAETGFLTFPACVPDSVAVFLSLIDGVTPKFIRMFIEFTRTDIEKFAPATAQKNINLGILNHLMVPLPPLSEQAVIVERAAALMNLCRQLETEIKRSRTNAENLLQAVLKEAFTSKTV